MNFHNLIPAFVPAVLFTYDSMGSWYKEIKTIDELSDLIYEESDYWFGGDNRNQCRESMISAYNNMVEMIDGNEFASDSFKLHDTTYRFKAL